MLTLDEIVAAVEESYGEVFDSEETLIKSQERGENCKKSLQNRYIVV